MGAHVLKSDGGEPSNREPRNQAPSRNIPLKEALQRSGPAPSGRPPAGVVEPLEPPWQPAAKPRPRRGTFEGDEAAVELRSRLAAARGGRLEPGKSLAPSFGAVLRFVGLVVTAAVAAGAVGYIVGVRLPFKLATRPAAATSGWVEAGGGASTAPVTLTAHHPASNRGLPAIGAGRTADGRAIDITAPAAGTTTLEAAPASIAPLPPPDASEIAARLKLGADLMAAGDIAAARTMFARIAEAGDAAGAFALAETYDPAVLSAMRLRGGITPDPVLARKWYEKARDMGSGTAPDRIARLAGR
jgi:hypothetical protein